ncbi:putative calcium-transporting ATPase 11, plasma membrane-type [Capsicum galapagoense]
MVMEDGILITRYNLLIDQSSMSGESAPISIYEGRPFLLSGTKVQDGSAKMLVTTVGMKTEWGKLMDRLADTVEDETPLQVELSCYHYWEDRLAFVLLTFIVLTVGVLVEKVLLHELMKWSSSYAMTLLNYLVTAVTIIVVAVPEGLLLAVALSLAFAMKS